MSVCRLAWFLFLMSIDPAAASATTYYVATTGSDSNDGMSVTAPFQTIQKAASVMQSGDSCQIRAGTYRETVTPPSGTAFRPSSGESVVISGADVVSGFSLNNGSIYTASLGWDLGRGNNQVFINGQMVLEARYPATPFSNLITPHTATSGQISMTTTSQPVTVTGGPQGNWNGATFVFVGRWQVQNNYSFAYPAMTGHVTDSNGGTLTVQLDGAYDRVPTDGRPVEYYLTGVMAALTSAGQWVLQDGSLYLWTPNSDNPSSYTVEVKHRTVAFNLNGKSNVTIQGLSLFAATITTDSSSHNNTIDGITASYVSHFTVMDLSGGVTDPEESHWNDTGIVISGTGNTLKNSRIAYAAGQTVALVGGSDNTATNNVIHDAGYTTLIGSAIGSGVVPEDGGQWSYNSTITYNTMYRTPMHAIECSSLIGAHILHNEIYSAMMAGYDGASIYCGGQSVSSASGPAYDAGGVEIAYNIIHDQPAGTPGGGRIGIYLDGAVGHVYVHHNLIYNVYEGLMTNERNGTCPLIPDYFYNNTVVAGTYSWGGWVSPCPSSSWVLQNNIFGNGYLNNSGLPAMNNNIEKDTEPGFVNAAIHDYRLLAPSPGASLSYPGATLDHGAFPYGVTPWTAGLSVSSGPPPVH